MRHLRTTSALGLAALLTADVAVWAATNDFICDGRVVVTQAMAVASLLMTPGSTLAIGDEDVVLSGDIRGSEYRVEFLGTSGTLTFSVPATWTGVLCGDGNPTLRVDGANLVFNGQWQGAAQDRTHNLIELTSKAGFYVGPDAILDHQRPDQIHAGTFLVRGAHGEVFELDPGFIADHGGFPDPDIWRARGFSGVLLEDIHLVTHATASLPAIHKRTAEGYHTHNGLIAFRQGTNNMWNVRSSRQVYDGAVWWRDQLEIRTDQDLILIGRRNKGSRCYFGTPYKAPLHTLTKTGLARMEIYGSQAYATGSVLDIQQGTVSFHTDPARAQGGAVAAESGVTFEGTNLAVRIAAEGRLRCVAPNGCGFKSVTCDGMLALTSPARASGPIIFAPGSTLQIAPHALSKRHPLLYSREAISGDVRLGLTGTPEPGCYPFTESPTVDLRLTAGAIPGFDIQLDGSNLVIQAVSAPTAPSAQLVP